MLERCRFTESEVKELIDSMVVIVDTREKKNLHITDYFEKHNIKYIRKALPCGDYSFYIDNKTHNLSLPREIYFDNEIIIERKASLEELSANFTTGRARIEEEFSIAKAGKKYLLIENANYSDVVNGNYDTQYNKKAFLGTLHSFNHKYNLEIVFMPDDKFTPIYILGVFQYYLKSLIK